MINISYHFKNMLDDQTQTSSINDIIHIDYKEDIKFSGIISYLLEKNNGQDENLKITGGENFGLYDCQYRFSNLLQLDICNIDQGYHIFTDDRKKAWIEYDFGAR